MAANHYTASVRQLKARKGRPWVGILRYQEPNPDYVPDPRPENARRKTIGRRANPDYIEDTRSAEQRRPNVTKQLTQVFDRDEVSKKAEALQAVERWRRQKEAEHAAPDAAQTVAEYVAQYIDNREREGTVTASTLHDYRRTARRLSFAPAIADVPMRELTPKQVQAWELGLLDRGLSGTTALKCHRLLKQVCKHAVEVDDLPKSPVRGFKAPSRTTGKPNALDAEGRMQAMRALADMPASPITLAAELALYCGLRRGEICALTWGNVDLEGTFWADTDEDGPKLRVSQSFGETEHGQYLKAPKTSKGRRVVPLGGGIVRKLKALRAQTRAEWAEAMRKAEMKPTEALFSTLYVVGGIDGEPMSLDALTKGWASIAKRANLVGTEGHPVTLHDLRHTFATNAITRGVDVATVADILGHEQISTTLNMYTSHDGKAKRQAILTVANDLDTATMGEVLPFVPRTGTDN